MDPSLVLKTYYVPQGISADLIATKYGFSRGDVDGYAVKARGGRRSRGTQGTFAGRVVPVNDQNGLTLLDRDEHMRPETTMQSLGALKPSFAEMGETYGFDPVAIQRYPEVEAIKHVHHAGNSSGIVDGAAAVLLGSAEGGQRGGLQAARPDPRLCQYRLGALDHADRPGRRHPQGAETRRA